MSQSLTAEAQKSLAVVLPGGTALSEIISCIRQKEVISTAKKGHLLSWIDTGGYSPVFFRQKGEQWEIMLCLLKIVHTFYRCAPYWRKNREVYPFWRSPNNNIKTFVHQTSSLHIESNSDRLWPLSRENGPHRKTNKLLHCVNIE